MMMMMMMLNDINAHVAVYRP